MILLKACFSQKNKNEWQISIAKGLSFTSNQRNEKQENKKIPTHICACFFYLEDSLCHILQTYTSDWLYLFPGFPLFSERT